MDPFDALHKNAPTGPARGGRQQEKPRLMKQKLASDISASTIQVIANQVLGLAIFLLTSRYLSKELYGEFNWSLASLAFITGILGLRLEQIVVRRVAAGEPGSRMLTLYGAHVMATGLLLYGALLIGSFLFPAFFSRHDLLLLLAVSQILTYFASPFKQVANGMEHFRLLALMSSIANLVRAAGLLLILLFSPQFTVQQVIVLYIFSSAVEFICCYLLTVKKLHANFSGEYGWQDYRNLVRESLPQAATVILNASIARIDWILLGIISTSIATAEYSFAYKVYELSPLPLLVIAPILLSRLSRFFSTNPPRSLLNYKKEISLLVRFEMIAATSIPLVLNLVWTPLMDSLTQNKYGAVNETVFLLLSCCIPFLYMNNLLWSVHFAQNKLALIFRITLLSFILILGGDLLLIPHYGAQGAAAVYLFAIMAEYLAYMRSSFLSAIRQTWLSPLLCSASALAAGFPAVHYFESPWLRLAAGIPIYCLLLLATKQLRKSDWKYITQFWKSRQGRTD